MDLGGLLLAQPRTSPNTLAASFPAPLKVFPSRQHTAATSRFSNLCRWSSMGAFVRGSALMVDAGLTAGRRLELG
jgi:hypothetical protein